MPPVPEGLICAQLCSKWFTHINSFYYHNNLMQCKPSLSQMRKLIFSQMRKLRHRELKKLAEDHIVRSLKNQDAEPGSKASLVLLLNLNSSAPILPVKLAL